MEKQQRVVSQVLERHRHDVPGAREPCMGVAHRSFGLKLPRPEPLVGEAEALAAVVVLTVLDSRRAPVPKHGAVLRHPVRNAGEELRQVQRGVGVVADAEQEHLAVEIVHPADGTLGDVGREREWIGGDSGSLGAGRGEGEEMVATEHAGHSPEGVRDDSEIR